MKYSKQIFVAFLFVVSSCNMNSEIKFNSNQWKEREDPAFPPEQRSKMVADLTSNYKLVGLKYSELVKLLGIPDAKDSISLTYRITVDYGGDIDPVYMKELNFYFSKDSVITSFEIDEWKK